MRYYTGTVDVNYLFHGDKEARNFSRRLEFFSADDKTALQDIRLVVARELMDRRLNAGGFKDGTVCHAILAKGWFSSVSAVVRQDGVNVRKTSPLEFTWKLGPTAHDKGKSIAEVNWLADTVMPTRLGDFVEQSSSEPETEGPGR